MGALVELLSYLGQEFSLFYVSPPLFTTAELGYNKARVGYSFQPDALAIGGVRGAIASGSILITFMVEKKRTRQHLNSELKGPSERDVQIYELHRAGKAAREAGKMFNAIQPSFWMTEIS